MKTILEFNDNWSYTAVDSGCPWAPDCSAVNFTPVTLPHDYGITGGFRREAATTSWGGYLASGVLYYRRYFSVTQAQLRQRISVDFGAVFMNSTVWINGQEVGRRPYGYIGFEYEITPWLHPGVNLICVRADCLDQPQSRWYNGCGIYQDVRLIFRENVCVARHGSYLTTFDETPTAAGVRYELRLENHTPARQTVRLESAVWEGERLLLQLEPLEAELAPGETAVEQTCRLEQIRCWSPEQPQLYRMVTAVRRGGELLETYETPFGIRRVEFIPHRGLFLNGRSCKLKGVCVHHDSGVAGAVFQESVWIRRLREFRAMGCNAIRTAHNPMDEKFYRLCDRMGFLVLDEFTDVWEQTKREYDYGRYFEQWYRQDAREFVLRDRNHPCVILWSIGNEIKGMTAATLVKLQDLFHQLDPSRKVTLGVCNVLDYQRECRALLDVAGYNDGGGACFRYEQDHAAHPEQLQLATEAPHTLQTRGFYRTQTWWRDHNLPRLEVPNLSREEIFFDGSEHYRSSYDNAGMRLNVRDTWKLTKRLDYLCGQFLWTGVDYYGESCGWPQRKLESGILDLANFRKDHFYLYQSLWTRAQDSPMVHLLPHWTHPTMASGTCIPVVVYTNCPEAELYLNGCSLGRKQMDDTLQLQWDVPYTPGELKAVAYLEGRPAAEKTVRTASAPARLGLSCQDLPYVSRNGVDTAQIDCAILDEAGRFVPYGSNTVYFSGIRGADWVGSENGDTIDTTALSSRERRAFYGLVAGTLRLTESRQPLSVTLSAILGDRYFDRETRVSIDAVEFDLHRENREGLEIRFTLDGTAPTLDSPRYTGPLQLTRSTVVTAAVYRSGCLLTKMQEVFTRGKAPTVPPHTRGNRNLIRQPPKAQPAPALRPDFSDGCFSYRFLDSGEFVRVLNGYQTQFLGYWCYDPAARRGELWFASGEKEPFAFSDETERTLIVDNRQAGICAFDNVDTLTWERVDP